VVLVLDPTGKVQRCNRYLLDLTGHSPGDVLHKDWFEMFIPDRDHARMREVFEKTVNQIKTRGIINSIKTSDGRECEVRWSSSTLCDADGNTIGVLSVGLDVTDLVHAQKIALQNERLVTIGATMTGLAHESRNALQRWQNAVELLHDQITDRPQALKDLSKIERAGRHIRDLLEEVRAYAAPIVLNLASKSMPGIWRRAWDSVAHLARDREVVFEESLPALRSPDDLLIRVDERRLIQVFRNLFENSMDSMTGALRIAIEWRVEPDSFCIRVRDNGPGVPASHRENLFDAFATSKSTGTGLGLAICRRVVEAHEGTIRLLANDSGAEFEIKLPRSTNSSS
ncbi:PAS domain-containing sensor histidine kinase, partial [Planctomycetota bacterium]